VSAPAVTDPWRVDTAWEVLPADAPRDEWLAVRREGLGGSDTSAVFGISQYTSPIRLWLDKTGRAEDIPDNSFMEWGRRLEPVAAEWFSDHYGVECRTAGVMRSYDHPLCQATPDRLTSDGRGLEVKTLEWHTEYEWDNGQTPDHAELQAQKCMLVTGRPAWWVLGLVNGRRPHVRLVERDDALCEEIARFETWWWHAYVVTGEMPPLDDSEATNDAVKGMFRCAVTGSALEATPELLGLLDELDRAKEAEKAAKARVTGLDSRVRLALGDHEVLVRDLSVPVDDSKAGRANVLLTFANNGAFNKKNFTEKYPALSAMCRKQTDVLDLDRVKTEHPDAYGEFRSRVLRPRKTLTDLINSTAGSK
jgi:putative phage-type endonuclease